MQRSLKRVVLDVETTGCRWEDFSDVERERLIRKADGDEDAARRKLALSPLTGELVLIGTMDPDTGHARIHVRWPPSLPPLTQPLRSEVATVALCAAVSADPTACGVHVWPDEAELLRAFWVDAARYDQVISFNGRAFDGPFLMIRSMVLGVEISRGLVPPRYNDAHLDLMDRLTCFGAMRGWHPLDFWCRRLGIPSPKDGGVHGADVERLWRAGDLASLCRYNFGDLRATTALFRKYAVAFGKIQAIELPRDDR